MEISFIAFGHPNITAKHRNTLEFTKDADVTPNGDCIVGVNADFSLEEIKKFVRAHDKAKMMFEVGGIQEEIRFTINKEFNDSHEIVIRKTDFLSKRTLGINADKASKDLKKELSEKLRDKNSRILISLDAK